MKRRTFYIVNLDRTRITALTILLTGFILVSFATGFRFGRSDIPENNHIVQNVSNTSYSEPTEEKNERFGKSIYSIPKSESSFPKLSDSGKPVTETTKLKQRKIAPLNNSNVRLSRTSRSKKKYNTRKTNPKKRVRRIKRKVNLKKKYRRTLKNRKYKKRKRISRKWHPHHKKKTIRKKTDLPTLSTGEKKIRTALLRPKNVSSKLKSSRFANRGKYVPLKKMRKFSLQIGSYRYKGGAIRMASRLRKEGFHPRIKKRGRIYQVTVGQSKNKQRLSPLKKRLQSKRYRPITVGMGP